MTQKWCCLFFLSIPLDGSQLIFFSSFYLLPHLVQSVLNMGMHLNAAIYFNTYTCLFIIYALMSCFFLFFVLLFSITGRNILHKQSVKIMTAQSTTSKILILPDGPKCSILLLLVSYLSIISIIYISSFPVALNPSLPIVSLSCQQLIPSLVSPVPQSIECCGQGPTDSSACRFNQPIIAFLKIIYICRKSCRLMQIILFFLFFVLRGLQRDKFC